MHSATAAVKDSTARDSATTFHPAGIPDFLPREHLRGLQSQRLRQVVDRAYEHVPLFRQRMHKEDLTPADIGGIDDLHKLPLLVRQDLCDTYPFDMLAVPVPQVARLHLPGGAPGKPTVAAYTRRDLDVWTELIVRSLASCGIHAGDVVLSACGQNRQTDALALHAGIEALGATVISVGGDNADQQIMAIKDFSVSAVCCTPSHFLYLVQRAEQIGVALQELPLRAGVFVAESFNETLRRQIEESAGIRAYEIFGLPEIVSPGIGAECGHQNGLHIFEDHFYAEIVDPQSGAPVADGQEGQLVLTTLGKEAMPLIRYRTPELAAIAAEPCPCGRTMRRIRRVGRHGDDTFVIQGVSVAPTQIEAALLAVEGTLPDYQIVLTQEEGVDRVEVQIEVTAEVLSDRISVMEGLQSKLAGEIEQTLGVGVPVRLVEPHTIQHDQDKASRIVDKREV
ncbi:MAG: phenylacetate--CoA ligase [Thermoguttaceae bacterium]